jgi:hypothetical protein
MDDAESLENHLHIPSSITSISRLRRRKWCMSRGWWVQAHEAPQWSNGADWVRLLQKVMTRLHELFALIALVQSNSHQVSCSNETIPHAPKHCETHQNISLGYNGVDQVCLLRKIPMQLLGKNFCTTCTSSTQLAPSFMKRSKMHLNTTKHTKPWVQGPMGWIRDVHCEKFWREFVARTFALIAPIQQKLHWVSCSNETIPNAPNTTKLIKTWV